MRVESRVISSRDQCLVRSYIHPPVPQFICPHLSNMCSRICCVLVEYRAFRAMVRLLNSINAVCPCEPNCTVLSYYLSLPIMPGICQLWAWDEIICACWLIVQSWISNRVGRSLSPCTWSRRSAWYLICTFPANPLMVLTWILSLARIVIKNISFLNVINFSCTHDNSL